MVDKKCWQYCMTALNVFHNQLLQRFDNIYQSRCVFIACQNFTQIIREISPDKVQTLPPFPIIWHIVRWKNYVEINEAFVWLASILKFANPPPPIFRKSTNNVYTVPSWITSHIFRANNMIFAVFATIVNLKHLTHKSFRIPVPRK